MDPHGVLGLPPAATPEDVAATYRRLAKQWHPDRGGRTDAERRMAEINAAYDLLRAADWTAERREPPPAPRAARPRGAWLPPAIRSALGHELLGVLEPDEDVWLVTPTTTWASPQALLAASDRRLLWLLDDAVSGRVQTLRFVAIEAAEHVAPPPPPPRRDAAGPRAQRPPLRVRRAAPGDGRRAQPADRRPIRATGMTASSASPAIAHQPAS